MVLTVTAHHVYKCLLNNNIQCQTPFVGDGISCTLDSDGDGYPDQALESPSCAQDTLFDYCKTVSCILLTVL